MEIFKKYEQLGLPRRFGVFVASMELFTDAITMHGHLLFSDLQILAMVPDFSDETVVCYVHSEKFRKLDINEEIPVYSAIIGKAVITTDHSSRGTTSEMVFDIEWKENTEYKVIQLVKDKLKRNL